MYIQYTHARTHRCTYIPYMKACILNYSNCLAQIFNLKSLNISDWCSYKLHIRDKFKEGETTVRTRGPEINLF